MKKETVRLHYAGLFKVTGALYIISAIMTLIVALVLLIGGGIMASGKVDTGTMTRADIRVTVALGVALLAATIASFSLGAASVRCRSLKRIASGARFVLVLCLICLVLTLLQGGWHGVTASVALSFLLALLSLLSVRMERRWQAAEAQRAAEAAAVEAARAAEEAGLPAEPEQK